MTSTVQYFTSLIPWAGTVHYQGDEGSCGPNMIANSINTITNLYGQPFEVNRQVLYNMYLSDNHALGMDVGVVMDNFVTTLATRGVTQNTDMDYGISHISEMPSQIDYTDAATHTLQITKLSYESYQENSLSHIISQELLKGKPLLMAYRVTQDFMDQTGPLSQQTGGNFYPVVGGHAVEIVSVDTTSNMLTVATWGSQYGDHGYYHLSLDSFYSATGGNMINFRGLYEINGFNGHDLTFSSATEQVGEAFVGILSRAPANPGMANYVSMINNGATLDNVCDGILTTTEGQQLTGSMSNTDYVQMLFHNVLGRDALSGGLSFYTNELLSGSTRGHVAAEIMTAGMDKTDWQNGLFFGDGSLPYHPANPDPNIYTESLVFQNKVTAAQDFAITLQAGSGHTDVAHNIISAVTVDPGSIWGIALVGVPEQLGYPHITPAVTS